MFVAIDDNTTDFGDLVSVELFSQLCDNINHCIDAMPVGSIIPILAGLPGVDTPDVDLWQECNGETIVHPRSPLRGFAAPPFDDGRYLRGYTTIGAVGNTGGANTKNLAHSHGGSTGENPSMETNADSDNDFWTGNNHTHSISTSLGVTNFEPEHIRVKHYIKINDTNDVLASKFKELEKDFGTTIAQSLWTKAAKNVNSLNKSYPIGMVLFFVGSQDNLPAQPDPLFWQLLDGSVVNNANSPLDGVTLPDFRNKFMRHPTSLETALTTGGSNTVNLSHNHGGNTGSTNDRNDFELDNGGETREADDHSHSISSDLGVVSTIPAYIELQCYVRIA